MDRLLRYIKDIRQATFFDVENVSRYFWSYPEDNWQFDHFTVAPPFDFFAMRYDVPRRVYDKKAGDWFEMPAYTHGVEILTVFRVVDYVPASSDPDRIILSENEDLQTGPVRKVATAKWHYDIRQFYAYKNTVQSEMRFFCAVDERGQIPALPQGGRAIWLIDSISSAWIGIVAITYIYAPLLALTFLHCKNVEVISPPPASRKRLPRKRKFETRYHRLRVEAIGQKREGQATGRKTGISQGLHIVRGHFRTYGEEFGKGKLFGKYAGRFWVAAHTSGSPVTGVVTKDYEVRSPKEQANEEL